MPLVRSTKPVLGRVGAFMAVLAVGLSPLLLGGVPAWAHATLTALCLLALLLHLVDRASSGRSVVVSWAAVPLGFGLAASLLMLVPLPGALRALLDASSTEMKAFIAEGLSTEAQALVLPVLAVDPPEAALAVMRWISALAVFLVISDRGRRRQSRDAMWRVLLGFGAAVLLVALFHRLANLDRVYGLVPLHADPPLKGPLVNPNHLARVLGAYALLGLAYLPRIRNPSETTAVVALCVCLGLGVAATLSVGGIVAFATVVLVGGAVWWLEREPADGTPTPSRGAHATPLLVGLGLVGGGLLMLQDALVREFSSMSSQSANTVKTIVYGPALRLIGEHPWVGVGPGGFRTALPSALTPGELTGGRWTHAENVVLDTLSSHGVILGAGVLALGVVTAWHLLRRLPTPALRAPLLVIAFLVVGDLFDFVLQIPAGLLLAATALALASAAALDRGAPAWRLGRGPALVAWSLLVVVSALAGLTGVTQDRRRFDRELADLGGDAHAALLERAMARHPLDPWYAYMMSVDARRRRDADTAIRWANRAIILDPNNGPAHIEAARVLWADGRTDQALAEYRQSWASSQHNHSKLIQELASLTQSVSMRVAAVPKLNRPGRFGTCKQIDRERRREASVACWRGALEDFPDDETIRLNAAHATLRAGNPADVLPIIAPLLERTPLGGEVVKLRVAARAHAAGLAQAFTEAEQLRPKVKIDSYALDDWMLHAAQRLGRFSDAQAALQRARRGATRVQRVDLDKAEARLLEKMGNQGDALMRWRRQIDANPRDREAHLELMRLQVSLGMAGQAETTLRKLRALAAQAPDPEAFHRRVDKLEIELELLKRSAQKKRPPLPE